MLAELIPDEPEVAGLLALLLLIHARRAARTGPDGAPVPLPEQDRARWDRPLIAEGHAIVRRCLRRNRPGPYQVQAAINAVHDDAAGTDWSQIVARHDRLLVVAPSPVAALPQAVAVAEPQAVAELRGGPARLALLDGPHPVLGGVLRDVLGSSHLPHAVRADLLRRVGRRADALAAYDAVVELAASIAERDLLADRRSALADPGPAPPDPAPAGGRS